MSFITKRERVFNDYDLYDLPARNESKLKEYGSCTDTRAWSHFTTDKTEHLVEVIKRNNEKCTPKYVPTKVIVETLMAPKNAEIERLKRKITQFEQMIAAYDQLDLNCAQRCEIARAQEAIRAANKDLDDMCKCLDLDLSGYTEAMDSEAYETGMSRADESDLSRGDDMLCCDIQNCEMWAKSVMVDSSRYEEKPADVKMTTDASTYARDTRVDELEGVIIAKDAKLSAMQNTIAVMENDICEPYCIYAHIYTAIEKIFGILCQNDKYKYCLDLLTKDKDVRQVDIKRKILYKMKVLEEFSNALIVPGTDEESKCSCYRAEVTTRIETTYALTSSESKQFQNKLKRSGLVADIIENKEMIELLDSDNLKRPDDEQTKDEFLMDNYSMNSENLNRLKTLQTNYDELVACYENMTCERNCLITQCQQYNELEQELEVLKVQLKEYNLLWKEKEHYKNRSNDLDNLKQKFLILCDETSNMELELKAATEINKVKSCTIEDLRAENILLEKKLNGASISFEKEKSALLRQLKETECKVMCQDQQIKSLSVQVDSLLEDSKNETGEQDTQNSLILLTEIETLKDQIDHLKDRLNCKDQEQQDHFQINLNLINELRKEVEDWKKSYEEVLDRNAYLQNFSETVANDNISLMKDVEDRKQAAENLKSMLDGKSKEINNLLSTIELKKAENRVLLQQLDKLESSCSARVEVLENNMQHVLGSLEEAKADSEELLQRMQKSDQKLIQPDNERTYWENKSEKRNSSNSLQTEELKTLHDSLFKEKNTNVLLLQKNQRLSNANNVAADNIDKLQEEKNAVEKSLQHERKTSNIFEEKLSKFEDLAIQMDSLKQEHQKSLDEKQKLEVQLDDKNKELEISNVRLELQRNESRLERKASNTLVEKLSKFEDLAAQMDAVKQEHQKTLNEKKNLEAQLIDKNKELDMSGIRLQLQRKESEELMDKVEMSDKLRSDLFKLNEEYKTLLSEKLNLTRSLDEKDNHIKSLSKNLQLQRKEIEELVDKLEKASSLRNDVLKSREEIQTLTTEKQNLISSIDEKDNHIKLLSASLGDLNKDKYVLTDKMQQIPKLEHDFKELQKRFDDKTEELNRLRNDLEDQIQENASLMIKLHASERKNNLIIDRLTSIETENLNKDMSLEAMKKESVQLIGQLKEHDRLETEFEELKRALHDAEREKDKLKTEFDSTSSDLQRLETENRNLKSQRENAEREKDKLKAEFDSTSSELQRLETENRSLKSQREDLRTHSKDLHSSLDSTRQELANLKSNKESYESLKTVIEELRVENLKNRQKTRQLRDELDQNEEIVSSLNEDIMKRDEKIATLQNYINELNHEMNIVQNNLKVAVETGEEISDNKHRLMDQSLKQVEAHHSKATHNFKMEVAHLQNEKRILEEKMSVSKMHTQESIRDKDEYKHQLRKIQYEKEMFVTELKQLEMEAVGDSRLSPEECSSQDIIVSFGNIRKSIEAKLSKTSSLEQAIQSSSQLLLSKTDEAKRFIEREKQKISIEREEAMHDRLMLEKQMSDLKESLEQQISMDKIMIDDLQGEIANQKLVMKKITEKTDSYIRKLEEELRAMKSLYENATSDVDTLQTKILMLSQDKDKDSKILELLHTSLETKTKELAEIQDAFASIKAKVFHNAEIQVNVTDFTKTAATETSIETKDSNDNTLPMNEAVSCYSPNIYPSTIAHESKLNVRGTKSKKEQSPNKNEFQVLTATVAPTLETFKSVYIDEKMNKLRQSAVSYQSLIPIQQTDNGIQFDTFKDTKINSDLKPGPKKTGLLNENGPSMNTSLEPTMSSSYAISRDKELNRSSTTNVTNENDMFFINRDSNSSNGETTFNKYVDDSNQNYGDNNLIVETVTVPEHSLTFSPNYQRQGLDVNTSPVSPHKRTQEGMKRKDTLNTISAQPDYDTSMSLMSTDMTTDDVTIKLYPQHYMNRLADSASMQTQLIQSNSSNDVNQFSLTPDSINDKKTKFKAGSENNTYSYVDRSNKNDEAFNSKMTRKTNHPDKTKYYAKDDKSRYLRTVESSDITNNWSNNQKSDQMSDQKSAKTFRLDLPSSFESVQYSEDENLRKSLSEGIVYGKRNDFWSSNRSSKLSNEGKSNTLRDKNSLRFADKAVLAKTDSLNEYENKIKYLTKALEHMERDSRNKLETIKQQYDTNIKNIINEHNQGVKNLQSLHEETLNDIIRVHDNEVENLRSMSIAAMRKADMIGTENMSFNNQFEEQITSKLEQKTTITARQKKRKSNPRDSTSLTKSELQAVDVKPRSRTLGPCTCSLDVNLSDTIRNMFEQVDVEQRKTAEHTYLRFIANKILSGTVESLDAEELSFLHFKVCRTWKVKASKEETLQKRIDSLESELLSKQQFTVQHIAELDRKVAQERSRLQEVRDAVCCFPPAMPPPDDTLSLVDKNFGCHCMEEYGLCELKGRPPGHPLPAPAAAPDGLRPRRIKCENHKAVLAQLYEDERVERRPHTHESIERRSYTLESVPRRSSNRESPPERRSFPHGSAERRPYTNEPPTRLRRRSDRPPSARSHLK